MTTVINILQFEIQIQDEITKKWECISFNKGNKSTLVLIEAQEYLERVNEFYHSKTLRLTCAHYIPATPLWRDSFNVIHVSV